MAFTYPPARPGLEYTQTDPAKQQRQTAEAVNRLNQGKQNTTIFVTLDPDVAVTVIVDSRFAAQTTASFCPTSANAATELATLWVSLSNGQMTINHTNSAVTDRTFNMSITG